MTRVSLVALAALLLSGCSGDEPANEPETSRTESATPGTSEQASSKPAGFDSPKAAFEAMKAAAIKNDFPEAVRCLSPDSQDMMAMVMTFPLAMMAAFEPEKEKEIEALLKRHGLSIDDESEEFPIDQIPDRIAFIADTLEYMEANSDGEGEDRGPIQKMASATLNDLEIEGDHAHGTIHADDGETEDIDFVQIGGRWFLELPDNSVGLGPMNSEDEFGTSFDGGFGSFEYDDSPPAPIEAVSKELFNVGWQVSMQQSDAVAEQLLGEISEEMGLELITDQVAETVAKTVNVDVSEVSRYELVESICSQIDVTPVFSHDRLMLRAGARETPVAFAGPFAAYVSTLETDPQSATGSLKLQVIAHGIPESVVQQMDEGFDEPIVILGATAANETALEHLPKTGVSYSGGFAKSFDREVFIGLKQLLRSVEAIERVDLQVSFSVPSSVATIEITDLQPGTTKQDGDVELSLTEVDDASFTFEFVGAESEELQLLGYDADGEQLAPFSSSTSGGGGGGMISLSYETSPSRFEARVVTSAEPMEYLLTLNQVPLPDHANMPEALPALTIDGDSPVTLEFVRVAGDTDFRDAIFRATNHTNKHMESIGIMMSYQDDSGSELENHSTEWRGEPIAPNESLELEVAAFFMPEEATKVVGTADAIEFTDASAWFDEE